MKKTLMVAGLAAALGGAALADRVLINGAGATFPFPIHRDGQKMAAALDYAPLPAPLVMKVEATLKTITIQGKPALADGK